MRYFLVDYENVNWAGLYGISFLTEDDTVFIFYSDHADTVNFTTLDYIMRSKALIKRHRITKFGNNALDFQLSTYVGYLLGTHSDGEVYIISKDQGYLSVLDFCREKLSGTGLKVEMYSSINGLLLKERSRNRGVPAGNEQDFLPDVEISKPELEPLNETKLPDIINEPVLAPAFTAPAKSDKQEAPARKPAQPEVVVKIIGKKSEPVKAPAAPPVTVPEEKPQLKLQIKAEDLIEKIAPKNEPAPAKKPAAEQAPGVVKIMTDDLTENISRKAPAQKNNFASKTPAKRETVIEIKPAEVIPEINSILEAPAAAPEVVEAPAAPAKPVETEKPKQERKPRGRKPKSEKQEAAPTEGVKTEAPAAEVPKKAEKPARKPRSPKKPAESALPDTPATIDYLKIRVALSVSKIESLVDADELERDEICEKITSAILNSESKQAFYLFFTKTFGQKQGVEYFNVMKKDFTLLSSIAAAINKENK